MPRAVSGEQGEFPGVYVARHTHQNILVAVAVEIVDDQGDWSAGNIVVLSDIIDRHNVYLGHATSNPH